MSRVSLSRSSAIGAALGLVALLASTLALSPRAAAFLYWPTWHATHVMGVARANLSGGSVNHDFIEAGNFRRSVAVDSRRVYWASEKRIGRARTNGSHVKQTFIRDANGPRGIAVDSSHIYWTTWFGSGISRARLNGSRVQHDFIDGIADWTSPGFGIAVGPRHIYWTNDAGTAIGRANLDGSGVDQGFITDVDARGIAVRYGHIYWAAPHQIGRADVNGSNIDPKFIRRTRDSFGVAVGAGHVFWNNIESDAIGRAGLDGDGVDQSFITAASNRNGYAYFLAVDGLRSSAG